MAMAHIVTNRNILLCWPATVSPDESTLSGKLDKFPVDVDDEVIDNDELTLLAIFVDNSPTKKNPTRQ